MRILLLASSALLALTATTRAQPARTLPETVVTATRIPTPLERIAAGVTVIDRAMIEQRGYTTLADALAAVPGLRIRSSGGPGAEALAFIRGAESRHTLVLIDGMPVNDPSNPGGVFDFGKDTLNDVERIEIVRGPMSTLYGSGAIGGVINVITRTSTGKPFSATGELAGGSPRQVRGSGFASGSVGAVDYAGSFESRSLQGSNAIADRQQFNVGERDGFTGQTGYARLGWKAADWVRFDGFVRQRYANYGLDNSSFVAGAFRQYDDVNYGGQDRFGTYRIASTLTPLDGMLESRVSANRVRFVRSFRNRPDSFATDIANDRYEGRRDIVAFDNTLRLPEAGPFSLGAATFGAERRWDGLETDTAFSALDRSDGSDALYAGLQGRLLRRLDLTGQLREELPNSFENTTTWRLGGVYQLPEIASRLRGAYGTSFRAPDLYDRFGFGGNTELRPEKGKSWEAGAEIDIPGFGRRDFATLGATYFHTRITDLIQYDNFANRIENVGRAKIKGVEGTATVRPAAWVDVTTSATWTDARNDDDETRLLRRPEWTASLSARVSPIEKLTVAPELIFVGRFRDALARDNGTSGGRNLSPSGVLFNLTANYAVTEWGTVFSELRNLGDSDFEPTNGFQTPGRSAVGGFRARW